MTQDRYWSITPTYSCMEARMGKPWMGLQQRNESRQVDKQW